MGVAIDKMSRPLGPSLPPKTNGPKITLKPGQTAFARLGIVDAGVISGCAKATGTGLDIVPPKSTLAQQILSFSFPACTNKPFMHVMKFQAGVGIP